jgi:hypothetical protein
VQGAGKGQLNNDESPPCFEGTVCVCTVLAVRTVRGKLRNRVQGLRRKADVWVVVRVQAEDVVIRQIVSASSRPRPPQDSCVR